MKKLNPFLGQGMIGLLVTLVIHTGLLVAADVGFGYMFTFYIVWLVFLIIGLRQWQKDRKVEMDKM